MQNFKFSLNRIILFLLFSMSAVAQSTLPEVTISDGWQLQDIAKVSDNGEKISKIDYQTNNWYKATVPGTVLTSLVNNNVYPEPLYGENNRPDKISEYLCRTNYWYNTKFMIPKSYDGKKIWLNFDGINYEANVWINGKKVGQIKGAFARGIFDITSFVEAGKEAAVAVLITPQPNPGISHEHTIATGMGKNGLYTSYDGPTFLCSIGWDWIPAIRDRNSGIWQKVFLSATDAVKIKDPFVVTDLNLPDTSKAAVKIESTIENLTNKVQNGILKGSIGNISFQQNVTIAPNTSSIITFNPENFKQLNLKNPRLWWPNGYGKQNLYRLKLSFELDGKVSDSHELNFGVREYSYSVPNSEFLTVSVNGVPVICKGGNWGMDEAMKRVTPERLEAQIKMHQLANYTMIRNWVGQSTNELLYELCDKYGLMIWDEFFQANPSDGPNPADINLYLYNVKEKILRYRNHPSIAVWCARNEGFPPKQIDDSLKVMMAKLEPSRLYQASSTDGKGVRSHGPYSWRKPGEFYTIEEAFKTESGTMSIPTLESIHGMMPQKDWEVINDDWAEHDFTKGAQKGDLFPQIINERYGKIKNLADFVRKSQLANYESYRSMYEGRFAKLFNPVTGILTWMSHPAQPSFVWQLYHYDLEPNASLFAVRKACEPIHIQYNEKVGNIQIINATPTALTKAKVYAAIYNLDGKLIQQSDSMIDALESRATDLPVLQIPDGLTSVYFIKLKLFDKKGKLISDNFYWKGLSSQPDNMQALDTMPVVTLNATAVKRIEGANCYIDLTLSNSSEKPAIMTHIQLRKNKSNTRVLPVYYTDNYVSLLGGESKKITIEASLKDLNGEDPLVLLDGLNVSVKPLISEEVSVKLNEEAQVSFWPETGLPFSPFFIEDKK
ncbi:MULTISPECIES: glycoside hydrolase family 2 protein [unclassified Flavobacterium]|uniref:glycoside hydrolase family 2 protein n=1 Tax=unclassified Flavobacterium TaxID=196869 RepID=UPI0025C7343F|nr:MULTISPECIES: sugar-binding domain-containing protein [unclassified Flavobacterium]